MTRLNTKKVNNMKKVKKVKKIDPCQFIVTLRSDEVDQKVINGLKKSLKGTLPGHNPVLGLGRDDGLDVFQFNTPNEAKDKSLVVVIKSDDCVKVFRATLELDLTNALPNHSVSVVNIGTQDKLEIRQVFT